MEQTGTLLGSAGIRAMLWLYRCSQALLALLGLAVLLGWALPDERQFLAQQLASLTWTLTPDAANGTVAAGLIYAGNRETRLEREQRAVAEFIAKRYRVADHAVAGFVAAAYRAGAQHALDPLLILAVAAVESRYNPVAESMLGAKGLMQIIPKFHLEKLLEHGGEHALLDADVNIQVGAQILREYLRRFGETETALQMYGGAFDEPTSQYAGKVLAERARLEQLLLRVRREA